MRITVVSCELGNHITADADSGMIPAYTDDMYYWTYAKILLAVGAVAGGLVGSGGTLLTQVAVRKVKKAFKSFKDERTAKQAQPAETTSDAAFSEFLR